MNLQILVVLSIIAVTVVLFVTEKHSPDIVALLAVAALLLTRVLNVSDALAGFSNPAVITIAAIFVITAGLTNTGVAAWFGGYLLRVAGKSEARLVAVTMGASAVFSLVMNNIASASVLLPGLMNVSRRTRICPSKLMIPLSFGTLLGGMATLFTTVNLLANSALRAKGMVPFSLWDYFRIGSILLVASIAFMGLVGRKLLPNNPSKEKIRVSHFAGDLTKFYQLPGLLFEAFVSKGSLLHGKMISETRLGHDFNLNVIGILRGRKLKLAPEPDEIVYTGDRLVIEGEQESFLKAGEEVGLAIEPNRAAANHKLADEYVGLVEVLLSPHAGVVGDTLLVQGSRRRIKHLSEEHDFIVLKNAEHFGEVGNPDKAPWALAGMGLMLVTAGFGLLPIAAAALVGALVITLSGALKAEEAYRAIEWKAVVMVGGMLALGVAMEKSGAVDLLSNGMLFLFPSMSHTLVIASFFLICMFLAQILSSVTTAVLIIPLALSAASHLQISAYPLMMTVVLGSSSGFFSPVSHPVNVLVMGPGGYRFSDFAKVGTFIAVIVFVLVIILVPRFWPF
jgi:di/tricarboxylate transporter